MGGLGTPELWLVSEVRGVLFRTVSLTCEICTNSGWLVLKLHCRGTRNYLKRDNGPEFSVLDKNYKPTNLRCSISLKLKKHKIIPVKVKVTQSCPTLCYPMDYSPWNSPGQNTGVSSLSLLQVIFPTHGSNPGLPPLQEILYELSHKGSPRILEWVAYPFSSGSS